MLAREAGMRTVTEARVFGMTIPVDQRRSGYPCRIDVHHLTPYQRPDDRDAHELAVHGAVHIPTPIAYSYQSGLGKHVRRHP